MPCFWKEHNYHADGRIPNCTMTLLWGNKYWEISPTETNRNRLDENVTATAGGDRPLSHIMYDILFMM